jgi:hypothetical protein
LYEANSTVSVGSRHAAFTRGLTCDSDPYVARSESIDLSGQHILARTNADEREHPVRARRELPGFTANGGAQRYPNVLQGHAAGHHDIAAHRRFRLRSGDACADPEKNN